MRAIWAGLINLAIYIGNIVVKNRRKRGEKEHPVVIPRDVQYYWRCSIIVRCVPYDKTGINRDFLVFFHDIFVGYARFQDSAIKIPVKITGNLVL